uniref:Dynamin GTPase domain-containing protein n=1 Tax=Chromera velia CCMP2878 TaxID=1169474 RepID=A0A0G4HVK8_9ALVE|eukprot:Cvel_1401.t1-p1 / transcript=Cvel_1401.t1 / gene=Cvel_1401 / organism=Chromera_velia_CCMP2878 / gene_product=Interferon-induced GTP-binding protein Mx, putative / transcript_product=Interferon-induced GTP-binding protein Mx, putative / location=Cvel_scaffold49:9693-12621(-) / protein_length=704 / sequence_SO=supercontig / SO=protein_coding / is_pseudo=false
MSPTLQAGERQMMRKLENTPAKKPTMSSSRGICGDLLNGPYGHVKTALEVAHVPFDFEVPLVVVCGDENVGKSSLMERLTKIRCLPRRDKLCTLMPIVVKLTHSQTSFILVHSVRDDGKRKRLLHREGDDCELTATEVVAMMTERVRAHFGNDKKASRKVLTNEFLQLEIARPDVIDLELVDLPGWVQGNDQLRKDINQMITRYITREGKLDPIVLTIISGSLPTLRTAPILHLVSEIPGAVKNCIAVVTHADTMTYEKMEDILVDVHEENAEDLSGIGQVVFVVNKETDTGDVDADFSSEALAVKDANEERRFKDFIDESFAKQGKPVPGGLVVDDFGKNGVLKQIVHKIHESIRDQMVKKNEELKALIVSRQKERALLGVTPETPGVVELLCKSVGMKMRSSMVNGTVAENIKAMIDECFDRAEDLKEIRFLKCVTEGAEMEPAYKKQVSKKAVEILRDVLLQRFLPALGRDAVMATFDFEYEPMNKENEDYQPLRLYRFLGFKHKLIEWVTSEACIAPFLDAFDIIRDPETWREGLYPLALSPCDPEEVQSKIVEVEGRQMVDAADLRAALEHRLEKLKIAREKVKKVASSKTTLTDEAPPSTKPLSVSSSAPPCSKSGHMTAPLGLSTSAGRDPEAGDQTESESDSISFSFAPSSNDVKDERVGLEEAQPEGVAPPPTEEEGEEEEEEEAVVREDADGLD